ncbi:nucleoporin Nup120/160-domain-containing protein [Protomyces lactucae-debilis]|uniref:Nucleoporin Nup120/160-domain-containing protein n=1 Tax=Protomyces lactucae-debilis TaxID=2754530 RepID=A0A1Y2FNU5_PROLT|nr:nucleoporin Nup120/160-domain-containing protein [Protomyces lactucae-debilis]ORY85599.1 nucleoporin Nup120/160-domain-containing protein [Protomyces lactucae-debilis]
MALADRLAETYCLTQVYVDPLRQSRPLVVARATGNIDNTHAAVCSNVLFRQGRPTLFYTTQGSRLTLQAIDANWPASVFDFGDGIRNAGLHDDNGNVIVHLFTTSHLLYTMILTPEQIEDPSIKKADGWIAEYAAPSFSIRSPLFMKSISPTSVLFSLEDGGLLRLSNNGRSYNEHLFSDSSFFKSFKSILPWSGRPANLIIAMQASPSKSLLFTLSVDAKLRIWQLQTGQLITMHDVSGAEASASAYLLDPVPINLLALHEDEASFMVVTYCPHQPGLFKVFKGETGLQEVFQFREEMPRNGLWRVFDLALTHISADQMLLHVLWKSDTLTLVQVGVVSLSTKTVGWSFAAAPPFQRPAEATDKLLERWIFQPSRLPISTLKRALAASTSQDVSLEHITNLAQAQQAARELLCNSTPLEIDEDTGAELIEKQEEAIRLQYLSLAQICLELDRLGSEPHALCRAESGEILVAQSDRVSIVRQANPLERLVEVARIHSDLPDIRTTCLGLCRLLGEVQTPDVVESLHTALRRYAFADRTLSADDFMFVCFEESVEQSLPRPVVLAMQEAPLKTHDLLSLLNDMLPLFVLKLRSSVVPQGVTGFAGYVAGQRDMAINTQQTLVQLVAILQYYACHATEADVFRGAHLFVKYLEAYKRTTLVVEACTSMLQTTGTDQTVFAGLAEAHKGVVPYRDLLERILVFLVSSNEGQWAVTFSDYAGASAFCGYLGARGKLLLDQAEDAAKIFARLGYPLVAGSPAAAETKLSERLDRRTLVDYHLHIARLFSARHCYAQALRFCSEAELALRLAPNDAQHKAVAKAKFQAGLSASQFDEAYLCLPTLMTAQQVDPLRQFLTRLCESEQANKLLQYPFIGLLEEVDDLLQEKADAMLATQTTPAYHRILYSWRVQHCNFRGAACALYRRLQVLQAHGRHAAFDVSMHLDLTEGYLTILNALRCMEPDEQWLIVGSLESGTHGDAPSPPKRKKQDGDAGISGQVKRKLLSLQDVREEYKAELHNMKVQLNQLSGLA